MTNTLYQNIQALGNKMASNLETMGVSASFNDGGLTLADKILQIQRFTDGLLLNADKSVDQSGNTVKLTALYMSNGETVSGKEVSFFGLKESTATSRTISSTDWVNVGCKYKVTAANDSVYLLDKGEHLGIFYNVGYFVLTIDGNLQSAYIGTDFEFEDGICTYKNSSNQTQTIDFTDYDLSSIKGGNATASITIDDYGVFDTTDDYGVATASYTCTGAGEKTITAMSGSVVSEPYSVLDGLYFEDGKSDKSSNWNLSSVGYSSNGEYVTLNNASGGNRWCILKIGSSTSYLDSSLDYCMEIDVKKDTATDIRLILDNTNVYVQSYISSSDFTHIKIYTSRSQSKVFYIIDGVTREVAMATANGNIQFRIANGESYSFKNFVVYPI